ncbi:IS3 family transposase [Corynebacterium rouxii]|uniref:IS3 family transposase n=1 Tax=Corynebacterium rouxii TaxID=2719119 RepID=UPI003CC7EF52
MRLRRIVLGAVDVVQGGNCYDNAVMKNFFGHLNTEMYYGEHFANAKKFILVQSGD